jgi:hypothetical protein
MEAPLIPGIVDCRARTATTELIALPHIYQYGHAAAAAWRLSAAK